MGRRRRTNLVDVLIDLGAELFKLAERLPWWVGAILAIGLYFAMNHFVVAPVASAQAGGGPSNPGALVVTQVFSAVALFVQYVLLGAILLGTLSGLFRSHKRKRLFNSVRGGRTLLASLSWRQFEVLVGEAFRKKGYTVSDLGGNGPDGGVDLALTRGGELYLVQCKHWKTGRVPVTVVRELLGVMTARGAKAGFVVASDGFTAGAEAFAKQCNITLIGGRVLKGMIESAEASSRLNGALQLEQHALPLENQHTAGASLQPEPSCPACGSNMVLRTARKGRYTGSKFWGCTHFPRCRSIVNAARQSS